MAITREDLKQEIDLLDAAQLTQLAEYISYLKFRSRFHKSTADLIQAADLYQAFADEDRQLAEAGMSDYVQQLEREERDEF